MGWRYKFDDGDEQSLPVQTTIYQLAAMAAFSRENVERLPSIGEGVAAYDGHVVELWDRDMVAYDPPRFYGIGMNRCGSVQLTTLSRFKR